MEQTGRLLKQISKDTLRVLIYSIAALSIFNICLFAGDALAYGAILLNNETAYSLRRKETIENKGNAVDANATLNNRDAYADKTLIDRAYDKELRERSSEANVFPPLLDQTIGCKIGERSSAQLIDDREKRFQAMINLYPKYVWCGLTAV